MLLSISSRFKYRFYVIIIGDEMARGEMSMPSGVMKMGETGVNECQLSYGAEISSGRSLSMWPDGNPLSMYKMGDSCRGAGVAMAGVGDFSPYKSGEGD